MNDDKIAVCPDCKTPLVDTMIFPGAEWFCNNCGGSFGMFGADEAVATPELHATMKAQRRLFEKLSAGFIPPLSYKGSCDKCSKSGNGYHHSHASEEELKAHEAARQRLFTLKAR